MWKEVWCWQFWPKHLHTEGQQQYYYKETKQCLARLWPSQDRCWWAKGRGWICSFKFKIKSEGSSHKWGTLQVLLYSPPAACGEGEDRSSEPAATCRDGLIWFIEPVNLRKSELWAVLCKPLQVKKEAVVIDAKNLLSWGEKCLCISMWRDI